MTTSGLHTVIYPAPDLDASKARFAALLGVAPAQDEPYYVGFQVGDQHIGLDPNGHRDGAVGYWHVDDLDAAIERLTALGAEVAQPATEVGPGRRIACVTDGGNRIGLLQQD